MSFLQRIGRRHELCFVISKHYLEMLSLFEINILFLSTLKGLFIVWNQHFILYTLKVEGVSKIVLFVNLWKCERLITRRVTGIRNRTLWEFSMTFTFAVVHGAVRSQSGRRLVNTQVSPAHVRDLGRGQSASNFRAEAGGQKPEGPAALSVQAQSDWSTRNASVGSCQRWDAAQ